MNLDGSRAVWECLLFLIAFAAIDGVVPIPTTQEQTFSVSTKLIESPQALSLLAKRALVATLQHSCFVA